MKRLPTASELSRARACLYWLRDDVEHETTPAGYPARVGTATHALIESAINGQPPPALDDDVADDARALYRSWRAWADQHPGMVRGSAEMTLAVSVGGTMAARMLGRSLGRDYSAARADEFVGTADLIQYDEDMGIVYVTDWKTTLGPDSTSEPAATNAQLHFLGLAAKWYTGAEDVYMRRVVIAPSGVTVDEHAQTEQERVETYREIRLICDPPVCFEAEPVVNPGCTYCPARNACPAMAPATEAIVGVKAPAIDLSTPDGIALARAWSKRVDEARERLDDAIKQAVRDAGGHVALPSGKHLRLVEAKRETIAWTEAEKDAKRACGDVKVSTYTTLKETNK